MGHLDGSVLIGEAGLRKEKAGVQLASSPPAQGGQPPLRSQPHWVLGCGLQEQLHPGGLCLGLKSPVSCVLISWSGIAEGSMRTGLPPPAHGPPTQSSAVKAAVIVSTKEGR